MANRFVVQNVSLGDNGIESLMTITVPDGESEMSWSVKLNLTLAEIELINTVAELKQLIANKLNSEIAVRTRAVRIARLLNGLVGQETEL